MDISSEDCTYPDRLKYIGAIGTLDTTDEHDVWNEKWCSGYVTFGSLINGYADAMYFFEVELLPLDNIKGQYNG